MILKSRTLRGVHLKHRKNTRLSPTITMPTPAKAIVSLQQHIGAPCNPLVNVGDQVYAGQKIGDSAVFICVPVHSPVSGKVADISEILMPDGRQCKCIVIESDGNDMLDPSLTPPKIEDRATFLAAVREAGTVGLGGAGFPTHVKLAYKDIEKIHTLYINVAECEPYITTDNREVMENVDGIIDGIQLVLKYTGIPKAVIVVENNKPIGTQILTLRCSEIDNISVKVIGTRYPKGAEKVLVYEAGGPVIPRGKLPADCGVIVMNVSTVSAISSYVRTGIPLIRRRVTVDGDFVENPKNISVAIGTTASDLLDFAEIDKNRVNMLLSGGSMMGTCLINFNSPITRTTNALLCFEKYYDRDKTPCIKCNRCVAACPVNLMPLHIEKAYDRRDLDALAKTDVDLCLNCGCCSYVCPAKRDLSHKNQLAKELLKNKKAGS